MTDRRKKPTKKRAKRRRAAARSTPPATDRASEAAPVVEPADEPPARPRRGQIESEAARFDLGPHAKVIGDALGPPPPGYGTTVVSLFVRDPRHVVAAWDVNDEATLARAAERGWQALELRIVGADGRPVAGAPVGERSGVYHVALDQRERGGVTVTAEIGFGEPGGEWHAVARSVPVRVPPEEPGPPGRPLRVRIPPEFDRRQLLRAEGPARVGHRPPAADAGPAARLVERMRLARRAPFPAGPPAPVRPTARGADGEASPASAGPAKGPPRPGAGEPRAAAVPPRAAGEPPRAGMKEALAPPTPPPPSVPDSPGDAAARRASPARPTGSPRPDRDRPRSGEGPRDRGGRSGEGPRP